METQYRIVTAVGVAVRTFGEADHAISWLKERRHELRGAYVERVTTQVSRECVYRPRLAVA